MYFACMWFAFAPICLNTTLIDNIIMNQEIPLLKAKFIVLFSTIIRAFRQNKH